MSKIVANRSKAVSLILLYALATSCSMAEIKMAEEGIELIEEGIEAIENKAQSKKHKTMRQNHGQRHSK